jgi:actin-like ATPase involved in cell morphogenesis
MATKKKKLEDQTELDVQEVSPEDNNERMGNNMTDEYKPGIGVDIGTSFIQVARRKADGKVDFISQRDAFYEIVPVSSVNAKLIERSLRNRKAFYLNRDNRFYVVGQNAIDIANERQESVQRPLKRGVLSARDKDSFGMLSVIIESLAGPAKVEKESCYYSYPADPIDAQFDAVFHQNVIGKIFRNLGYAPTPVLEAEALVYSELLDEDLTGVTISCGAGMTNVCVAYMGENILSFSVAKGGDWIDESVATQMGLSDTVVQAEKEAGIDLFNPDSDIKEGIAIYYDTLIKYVADSLEYKFRTSVHQIPKFKEPIIVVVSGGTSLAGGFLQKLEEALVEKTLPFGVKEMKPASDPLRAVANGALIAAQL